MTRGLRQLATASIAALALLGLAGPAQAAERAIAVTASNRLLVFSTDAPSTIERAVQVSGLQAGETIRGIDFRPLNGQLLALGSTSRLYRLNPITGGATQVGGSVFDPALSGTNFGFDFNPAVDRLRVVSDADQNLRLDPNTGAVAATDPMLTYAGGDANAGANPNVVASAYTNNVANPANTTLFGIDSAQNTLVRQGSPRGNPTSANSGVLFTIGNLGVNASPETALDIAPSGAAFAAVNPNGASGSSLYAVDLGSGYGRFAGTIGGGEIVRGLALAAGGADLTPPVAFLDPSTPQRATTLRSRGLLVKLQCDEACVGDVAVTLHGATVGSRTITLAGGGGRFERIALNSSAQSALSKRNLRFLFATASVRDIAGNPAPALKRGVRVSYQ